MSGSDRSRRDPSTVVLAGSTLLAAIFVAVQAWYARVSFVEADLARHQERMLDACFEDFEAAASLDSKLRAAARVESSEAQWPPMVLIETPEALASIQRDVVPLLDNLQNSLTKSSVLGPLDKHRTYLAQTVEGLGQKLLNVVPADTAPDAVPEGVKTIFKTLSEFLGAQYSVFAGCRLVAEGKS